jgi:hypothetical protein
MIRVREAAAVLDYGRFVASASPARSRSAATVAYFSIATIAEPFVDTPGCSSASSDASGETSSRIPSTSTHALAAVSLGLFSVACCLGCLCLRVDFCVELTNLY